MQKAIFTENRLVFKGAQPQSLFNPTKSPSEFNAEAVNPAESIAKFEGEERNWAAKAWQHPLKDALKDNIKDARELVHATLYPAQAGLNIIKSISSETSEAVTKILSKYLTNPVKIIGRTAFAPLAFLLNNVKRSTDLLIKYPFSAINIAGSFLGRPALAASSFTKKAFAKITSTGDKIEEKLNKTSSDIKSQTSGLKIPGLDKIKGKQD